MVHLAEHPEGDPVRVDDIASELGVPRNYLSKVLHTLARVGILDSTRGPRGGFTMARAPKDLVLSEIIGHFDDISERSGCLLGRERCADDNPCPAHHAWKEAAASVREFLLTTTLADLTASGRSLQDLSAS